MLLLLLSNQELLLNTPARKEGGVDRLCCEKLGWCWGGRRWLPTIVSLQQISASNRWPLPLPTPTPTDLTESYSQAQDRVAVTYFVKILALTRLA